MYNLIVESTYDTTPLIVCIRIQTDISLTVNRLTVQYLLQETGKAVTWSDPSSRVIIIIPQGLFLQCSSASCIPAER